jgi:hypothetical protein
MGQILKFIGPEHTFDPETLRLLGEVYDLALAELHDKGQPRAVQEIIATWIIASAMRGERNPDKLRRAALRGIVPAS